MGKLSDQEKIKNLFITRKTADLNEISLKLDGACPGCGLSLRRKEGYPPIWYSINNGRGEGGDLFCKKCVAGYKEVFEAYQKKLRESLKNI